MPIGFINSTIPPDLQELFGFKFLLEYEGVFRCTDKLQRLQCGTLGDQHVGEPRCKADAIVDSAE